MNRLRSALLGLGLLLMASAAKAQDNQVKANIPFDFVVGNQVLAAGEYRMITQGSGNEVILIRSEDNKAVALTLSYACTSLNPSDRTKLVFHSLAGRYFLSQIWAEGETRGRQVPKSGFEVQLAKNNHKPEEFVLAASLTR